MEENNMNDKINVLVIGNSGAGKSTLINAIIKKNEAEEWIGTTGTKTIKPYENEDIPFRLVDTRGLEYGFWPQVQTKFAIEKWCKEGIKSKNDKRYIQAIWYCLDASAKRLFKENLDTISNVAKMWRNVPIIIVITKSYSEIEDEANTIMVKRQLKNYKNDLNIKSILTVIAKPYPINNEVIVPPKGLDTLIDCTNQIIPEAKRITQSNLTEFEINIKRNNSMAFVSTMTIAAGAVGAIPIPIADSLILIPLQTSMVTGIANIYKIDEISSDMKKIVEEIAGTSVVSQLGKNCVSLIKAIPGLNIAAALINAFVAGSITATLGGISIAVMEKIIRGEIKADDYDWINKFVHSEAASKLNKYVQGLGENSNVQDVKQVGNIITNLFKKEESKNLE